MEVPSAAFVAWLDSQLTELGLDASVHSNYLISMLQAGGDASAYLRILAEDSISSQVTDRCTAACM